MNGIRWPPREALGALGALGVLGALGASLTPSGRPGRRPGSAGGRGRAVRRGGAAGLGIVLTPPAFWSRVSESLMLPPGFARPRGDVRRPTWGWPPVPPRWGAPRPWSAAGTAARFLAAGHRPAPAALAARDRQSLPRVPA